MNNLRFACRQMLKHAGLSTVVVLTLALGVGATTAMFSLFHGVLMRSLPVPEPGQLVILDAPGPKWGRKMNTIAGGVSYLLSYPMFRDLESRQTVFTGLGAYRSFSANISHGQQTLAGRGMLVSGRYFDVLELHAALGRLIGLRDEPRVGESGVVVLSYAYWRNRFGGDPNVIGRTLTVNGQALKVIGVAPVGFTGTTEGFRPEVFVPLTLRWFMEPTVPHNAQDRRAYWLYSFARLKAGISMAQASAGINRLYSGILNDVEVPLNSNMPKKTLDRFRHKKLVLEPGARGLSSVRHLAIQPLSLLLGITSVVLLIVCVNIASLLLARSASRTGEMALRVSLGASRGRLVSQLLLEAGVLAVVGGAFSLPVAALTLEFFAAIVPHQLSGGLHIGLSPAAILFASVVSLFSLVLFGLIPSRRAARPDLALGAKRQTPQSGSDVARTRSILATAQIAFSMILLVLAGLFARSLVNIAHVNLGMNVDSLVTFRVSPRLNGYSPERVMSLYDRLEAVLAQQPGVTDVASSFVPLLEHSNWSNTLSVQGFQSGPGVNTNASANWVSPGFFRTVSIPIVRGRDFTKADVRGATKVAVVNRSFVRKFDLGDDAIGKTFEIGTEKPDIEIVGVVGDAKYSTVKGQIPAEYYLSRQQDDNLGSLSFYVRGGVAPGVLLRMIPRVVKSVDPHLPVSDLEPMRTVVGDSVYLDRLVTVLSSAFAGLATLLAAIGLYGVLAYSVTRRTRELGLRLALGATPGRLRRMVLKQVALMGLMGGAVGAAAAVGIGRAASALLYGLSGYDPLVLAGAAVVLAVVVLSAGYLPARSASNTAPMEALRYE